MSTFYRFDDFEVDGEALELRRGGEPVPLPPQAVRALLVLLRNAGRLVSRDELYGELWSVRNVDVDRGLNTVIRQIRIALGDDANRQTHIRTYPRRGYRFLGEVFEAAAPGGPAMVRPRRIHPKRAAVVGAIVVSLAGLGFWLAARGAAAPERAPDLAADLPADVRERYLEGRYLVELPRPSRRAEAVAHFEVVVAAEPDYAPGHAWLSDALFWAGRLEDARAAADRALSLDATQARARIVRGTVMLVRDWDPPSALDDLREAVRLSPDDPDAHHALAFALATTARHEEAVRELETATDWTRSPRS